jgi:hypothetical protein
MGCRKAACKQDGDGGGNQFLHDGVSSVIFRFGRGGRFVLMNQFTR